MITGGKPLVLCIEDEADIQEIIQYQLEDDFDLIFAKDGKEGVRLAIFHRPDLILMDLMMPKIDGIQASEMIKKVTALNSSPLVALTAASKEIQERALKAGVDLVLEKPALNLPDQLKTFLNEYENTTSP